MSVKSGENYGWVSSSMNSEQVDRMQDVEQYDRWSFRKWVERSKFLMAYVMPLSGNGAGSAKLIL
jgi:hypothetical protein